jgi:glycosyltransferase involved in cell wall biosynthesis
MKVLLINSVCGIGSTGRITTDLSKALIKENNDSLIIYGRDYAPAGFRSKKISSNIGIYLHVLYSRIFDRTGFASKMATKKLIKIIENYNPSIIHLHNLHGYYINIKLLFDYLSNSNIPVVWTLHDCWAVTGHCAHFDFINCEKWKSQCYDCPQKKEYPKSILIDNSKLNYINKKEIFNSINNLTIVTPSKWLLEIIKESFLSNANLRLIHNGIDLSLFKPTTSNFKKIMNLHDKRLVLGVANIWTERKGYKDFVKLSYMLDDEYRIVLVGLSKDQIKELPNNIIGIQRTRNVEELVNIYNSADVFVNLTYEDNFPTTNIEALACGTPVITYNTGGSAESLSDKTGIVIVQGDIQGIKHAIERLKTERINKVDCVSHAEKFNKDVMFKQYIDLYAELCRYKKEGDVK